jgi:hypothetical protein
LNIVGAMETIISGFNFGDDSTAFGSIAGGELFKSAEHAVFSGNRIAGKRARSNGATAIGGRSSKAASSGADAITIILDALRVEDGVPHEKDHD